MTANRLHIDGRKKKRKFGSGRVHGIWPYEISNKLGGGRGKRSER